MAERRAAINKRWKYAFRLQVWTPDGHVMIDGPSDKKHTAALMAAALVAAEDVALQASAKRIERKKGRL